MKQETKIKMYGVIMAVSSLIYMGCYIADNEFNQNQAKEQFTNGEVLLPDYVHSDTLVVINAALLNEQIPLCDGSDGSYSDVLGEGTVNIADYQDYMNVVNK